MGIEHRTLPKLLRFNFCSIYLEINNFLNSRPAFTCCCSPFVLYAFGIFAFLRVVEHSSLFGDENLKVRAHVCWAEHQDTHTVVVGKRRFCVLHSEVLVLAPSPQGLHFMVIVRIGVRVTVEGNAPKLNDAS